MHQELVKIRRELGLIPMVDNFVAHARLQRKFNSVEATLKQETNTRLQSALKYKFIIPYVCNILISLAIIYIGFTKRDQPVLVLEGFNLFPFSYLLSYPIAQTGAVSVHAWFCICRVVTRYAIS